MIIANETITKHIDILRNAKQQGSLAVFVGCGVSRATSKKYKLWGDIIEELKNELNSQEEDFLKLAQLYSLEFGSIQIKKKVRDFFPDIDEPGELQKSLVNLRPHYIITTNWDCLIDNAIDDNPGIIDKIASDKELVQSDKDKKYLKIHGDFIHNNFVFTEDDYLNYSYNFPLIENFIKSILSTHVVLLLGYSFSDWDLKQIISWLRHNSKEQPPIYMVEKNDCSNVNAKYYDNLGIHILPIYKDYDEYEKKVLELIKKIDGSKICFSEDEPEKYIYSVLTRFEKYPLILQEMITKALTNSSIVFDSNNRAILELNVAIETKDKNNEKRNIYKKFCENVDTYIQNNNEYYKKIIEILKKADIHGFSTDKALFENNKYYSFDDSETELYDYTTKELNFDFIYNDNKTIALEKQMQLVFNLFYTEEYEKAFSCVKELLKKCRQERNYFINLISLFNYNIILHHLKYSFSVNPEISKKYRELEFVNLEREYDSLPEGMKDNVKFLYNFINFSFFYKESFSSANKLIEVRKRKHVLAHGGISFSSEIPGYLSRLKNLTEFVLNNHICIEDYKEYRNLCQSYLQLHIENSFAKEILFGKIEVYTSIKCFNHKELKEFYETFYNEKPEYKIVSDENTINWLIDVVFNNCIELFVKASHSYSISGEYCQNCLFFLSLLTLNKDQTDKILKLVVRLVAEGTNSEGIFENINVFIGIQYNVFQNKNIDGALVLSILETLLLKFVNGKINGHEHHVLTQSKIANIYGLSHLKEKYFTNKELLQKVIYSVKLADTNEQILWVQHVLIPIYQLSNDNCKEIIKKYVSDPELERLSDDLNEQLDFYIMKLLFIATKIEETNYKIINDIEAVLNRYPKNTFSGKFYTLQSMVNSVSKADEKFEELKIYLDKYIKDKRKLLPFGEEENKQ